MYLKIYDGDKFFYFIYDEYLDDQLEVLRPDIAPSLLQVGSWVVIIPIRVRYSFHEEWGPEVVLIKPLPRWILHTFT